MTPSVERKALQTDYRSIPGPTERRLFVLLARARESENRTSFPTALRPKLPAGPVFVFFDRYCGEIFHAVFSGAVEVKCCCPRQTGNVPPKLTR